MGRKKKHWAELARSWIWYFEVKKRCGWTDYKLDVEFAWKQDARDGKPNEDRPRTFECLRRSAQNPTSSYDRRGMAELVCAVEKNPLFQGTQVMYEADFWNLAQGISLHPDNVDATICRLLDANDLVRADACFETKIVHVMDEYGLPVIYDRCLRLSLNRIDNFSQISLLWGSYLLSEPSSNWKIRDVIKIIADQWFDNFFAKYLPEKHGHFYPDALHSLQSSRLDLSKLSGVGYGYFETLGNQIIIPKVLLGKLVPSHLGLEY